MRINARKSLATIGSCLSNLEITTASIRVLSSTGPKWVDLRTGGYNNRKDFTIENKI